MADKIREAESDNNDSRGIKVVRSQKQMKTMLEGYSGENLLIQGWDHRRVDTLFYWLQQLYRKETARPIVVVTHDKSFADRISKEFGGKDDRRPFQGNGRRPFLEVSQRWKSYHLFQGLPPVDIQKTVEDIFFGGRSVSENCWDESLFFAVCDILLQNGYTTSIYNLLNIFSRRNDTISELLEAAGKKNEAEKAASTEGNRTLADMKGIFQYLAGQWEYLMAPEKNDAGERIWGHSLYEMSAASWRAHQPAPFVLFVLDDNFRQEILDCLKAELEALTEFTSPKCETSPVLVMDSVSLAQSTEDTAFYNYIKTAGRLSLTISAEDCCALMKDEADIHKIVNKYRFRMILINGTQNVELLTKGTLGLYSYRGISETAGKIRASFDLMAHDKNTGITIQGDERRVRLDGEDMRYLNSRSCFICKDNEIKLYREMEF